MGRTLIVPSASSPVREWLRENRDGRDLILLDPLDTVFGPAARIAMIHGDKTIKWRFLGSLDAQRLPHTLIASLGSWLYGLDDVVIVLPSYRPTPVLRQTFLHCAQMIQPDEIWVTPGEAETIRGWPIGPSVLENHPQLPIIVSTAQRKARWLKLFEEATTQTITIEDVSLEGSRIGSGVKVDDLPEGILYAESCGATLFVICDQEPEDAPVARMMSIAQAERLVIAQPKAYENLLCSFARQNGEDFAIGVIESIDFSAGTVQVMCTAVPPAPVRILRLGSLRVDKNGNELPEIPAWSI